MLDFSEHENGLIYLHDTSEIRGALHLQVAPSGSGQASRWQWTAYPQGYAYNGPANSGEIHGSAELLGDAKTALLTAVENMDKLEPQGVKP